MKKNICCSFDWFMYIKTYFYKRNILHTDSCDFVFFFFFFAGALSSSRVQNIFYVSWIWEFISYLLSGLGCVYWTRCEARAKSRSKMWREWNEIGIKNGMTCGNGTEMKGSIFWYQATLAAGVISRRKNEWGEKCVLLNNTRKTENIFEIYLI